MISEDQFYYSNSSSYVAIDLSGTDGTDGDNGSNGADGIDGSDGISIVWLGSLSSAPTDPNVNNAYYNTTVGISFIWDGDSWQILAQDGSSTYSTVYHDLPGWNMNSYDPGPKIYFSVLGIPEESQIMDVQIFIQDDTQSYVYDLYYQFYTTDEQVGGYYTINYATSTDYISIGSCVNGYFRSSSFSDDTISRGYMLITY